MPKTYEPQPTAPRHAVVAEMFTAFPMPLVVMDADGRIVDMNPAAESLWVMGAAEARGVSALEVLGLSRIRGRDLSPWPSWSAFRQEIASGERVPCRIIARDGHPHLGSLVGSGLTYRGDAYLFLAVTQEHPADSLQSVPAWALTDPVTGLHNRVYWAHRAAELDQAGGVLVMLDVDDLKSVNDRYGHGVGDNVLALVGSVLRAHVPPEGLAVRYGGDEFLVRVPLQDADGVGRWVRSLNGRLEERARAEGLPEPPHLSFGVARYEPGQLLAAVRAADDAMYEQKGTILRSRRGGRLIVGRASRLNVQGVDTANQVPSAGTMAKHFGPEFDRAYRAAYQQAIAEARDFVAFAGPEPGTAVLEVGAGTGRLAFDGGLADRIGPDGVLLLTDPSAVQLEQARQRAAEHGATWLHFLVTPAETLPLAPGGADLVIGAWFLHLCDADAALREFARVVRPGGRVVLDVTLVFPLTAAWEDMMEPLRRALALHGLPFQTPGHRPGEVAHLCRDAGLTVERQTIHDGGLFQFPDWTSAWQALAQGGHLHLMSRGLPEPLRSETLEQVKRRMADVFPATTDAERVVGLEVEYVAARKPG